MKTKEVEGKFWIEKSYPAKFPLSGKPDDTLVVLEIRTFKRLPNEFFKDLIGLTDKHC